MSQNTRESLSALMDGEGDDLALRRVLKALPDDAGAADTWRRYHLARSLMQHEPDVDTGTDLSAGIMARLQDEPVPAAPDASSGAAESKPRAPGVSLVRGAGVAAAVSLMVITGVQYFGAQKPGEPAGSEIAGTSSDAGEPASTPGGAESDATFAQPAALASNPVASNPVASNPGAANPGSASDGDGMPMFEPTPFRLNQESRRQGLMTVSDGGLPEPMEASQVSRQTARVDSEQVQLLQSYLQQHAHGAAYSNSDSWLPLTRSSAMSEALGR